MHKTVMVVDDSRFIYEEMKLFLDGSDFEIIGYCQDGEGALKCYEESKPDVVTMDIVLPGIDGFEAASQILSQYPEAKIVMISSLAYDDTISRAKEIGSLGFLFKPLEKTPLLETLTKIFD